jgi:large subunit ribosomal protein L6e
MTVKLLTSATKETVVKSSRTWHFFITPCDRQESVRMGSVVDRLLSSKVPTVLAFPMTELLFIAPVQKKDPTRPTWRGIPRLSLTRPKVASEIDPITTPAPPPTARTTRPSLAVGTVVIILTGEYAAKRAVVTNDAGAGVVTVVGSAVPPTDIDQDFLIATSTKLAIAAGADQAAVAAAAGKVPELADYLAGTFTLKPGDRPHLLKF